MNEENYNEEHLANFLVNNQQWVHKNNALRAEYVFSDFNAAMEVINDIACVAEELNHHPFWSNVYNKVSFSLSTHDAGDVVTELDVKLAEKIVGIINSKIA